MIATAVKPRVRTGSNAPRVLFVAPFEPWCRENGSSVVIADLLAGLAAEKHAEILPVFLRRPPAGSTRSRPPAMEGVTLGVDPLPKWFSVPFAVMTGRSPWWEVRFAERTIARRIAAHARASKFAPTVVHVEHLVLVRIGAFLARTFGVPLVYRAHNIESQLWSRRVGDSGPVVSRFLNHLENREVASIKKCDLTLCISEVDRQFVASRAPGAAADVLPVGLSLDRFQEIPVPERMAPQICFVGGLDWPPNEVGLRWFLDNVFPRVLAQVPDARLAILARGAVDREWLREHPNVDIMPGNTDPARLFASSRLSIAPLLDGGGVRVKIIESLAAGCPVVATSIGGEGLVLRGLTHTDDPATFASSCSQLLLVESVGEARRAAQAGVMAKHEARAVAGSLIRHWKRVSVSVAPAFAAVASLV